MNTNKVIKYVYLALSCGFQLYLAYASTLYLEVGSLSFSLVVLTAIASAAIIGYYILVRYEKENLTAFKPTVYQNTRTNQKM